MALTSKITPFLWFPSPLALEAAQFYTTLFNASLNPSPQPSTITAKSTYTKSTTHSVGSQPMDTESILTVNFTLAGQPFIALNGPYMPENPQNSLFPFNEAISFSISCDTQDEVDYFWDNITQNGGKEVECGWCKDKFGVCWQVVPKRLVELMGIKEQGVGEKVGKAMRGMKKFDISGLEEAAREAREGTSGEE